MRKCTLYNGFLFVTRKCYRYLIVSLEPLPDTIDTTSNVLKSCNVTNASPRLSFDQPAIETPVHVPGRQQLAVKFKVMGGICRVRPMLLVM